MPDVLPGRPALQAALADAARAHHDYESVTLGGVRHEQWSGFYAAYVLGRLGDFTSASRLAALLEEVTSPEDWSAAAAAHCSHELAK